MVDQPGQKEKFFFLKNYEKEKDERYSPVSDFSPPGRFKQLTRHDTNATIARPAR